MTSLPPGAIAQSGFAQTSTAPTASVESTERTHDHPKVVQIGLTVVVMGNSGLSHVSISGSVSGQAYHITGSY